MGEPTSSWSEMLEVDPSVGDGREICIRGTGLPVSAILLSLARDHSDDELRTELSRHQSSDRTPVTPAVIQAAAAYAANLVREKELSPPARTAFVEWDVVKRSGLTFGQIKALAPEVLDRRAVGRASDDGQERPWPTPEQTVYAYASVLSRDQRLPPAHPEDTTLRDLLDDTDRRLVDDYIIYRSALGARGTPERHLSIWARVVEQVEDAYNDDIYELLNWLGARETLEKTASLLTPWGQERWRAVLRPWDDRFYAATRPSAHALWGIQRPWKPRSWWWYRVPTSVGPKFQRDLEDFGLA